MISYDNVLRLNDVRKSDAQQLWAFGDSITVAQGITEEQKYYNIVNSQLNLPVSVLAEIKSSIEWAADQILRSDIRKNDTVLWGLTSRFRCPYFLDNKIIHVHITNYNSDPGFREVLNPSVLDSDDNAYKAITSIHQVINFCKNVGAKLYIIGVLTDDMIEECFANTNEFISTGSFNGPSDWVDLAPDQQHPGPIQHKIFADKILERMKL